MRATIFSIGAGVAGLGIMLGFAWRAARPGASGFLEGGLEPSAVMVVASGVYGFAMTLVGVALGSAYRKLLELKKTSDPVHLPTLIKDIGVSVDFYIGLVGAPIVFGLIWQSLGEAGTAGLTFVALQNGFVAPALIGQIADGAVSKKSGGTGESGTAGSEDSTTSGSVE